MASTHSRTVSAAENRRSATLGGPRTRVHSLRVGDGEKNAQNDSPSSNGGENIPDEKSTERRTKHVSATERRLERNTTITKERIVKTRSPVKQNSAAGDGREMGNNDSGSPVVGKSKRTDAVIEEIPWEPQASLIPHSSAPLAIRVSAPPLSSLVPKTLEPKSFKDMTTQEQETAMIDDLLYVLMGYEGQYVRFVDAYRPTDERSRLAGPEFRILPGLDPSLRDLSSSMLQMATHHMAINAFVEVQSRAEFGSVNHALCAAIRTLLKDYMILIAQLENKVINDPTYTLHQMHLHTIPTSQSLHHLNGLAQELLKKNSLLDEDLDESIDDFDADNILERLREHGELLPGSMGKNRCIGGKVLALVTDRLITYSGDPAARTLLEMLLREASKPYVAMLNEWLHQGRIKDSHSEFLVGERSGIKRERMDEDYTDEYWEKRYYIRDRDVPPQLESVKEKILLAGKYLNVVRECGGVNVSNKMREDVPKTFSDPRLIENVNSAYTFANASLLQLLLTKNSLRSRLRSLKHYFFLDRAEFFIYFREMSKDELRKTHNHVNVGKLQRLLDLALHQPGSIAASDAFKDDVSVQMNEMGLTEFLMKIVSVKGLDQDNPDGALALQSQTPAAAAGSKDDGKNLDGFSSLTLDYKVPFPLSLVISRKTILRYQLLFRYMVSLRRLEMLLVECWSDHSKEKAWIHRSTVSGIEKWKRRAWCLRSRMLVFVQQMLFYCTEEVLEANWKRLMAKVDEAEDVPQDNDNLNGAASSNRKSKRTVDELMQDHLDMLDSCMKDLGLTQRKLLRVSQERCRSPTPETALRLIKTIASLKAHARLLFAGALHE